MPSKLDLVVFAAGLVTRRANTSMRSYASHLRVTSSILEALDAERWAPSAFGRTKDAVCQEAMPAEEGLNCVHHNAKLTNRNPVNHAFQLEWNG